MIKKINKCFQVLVLLVLFPGTLLYPTNENFIVYGKPGDVLMPEVTFLETRPEVDGRLDNRLKILPVRKFNYLMKLSPSFAGTELRYRMAYGTGFLYLFIEMDEEKFLCRDRAYQNGDGFILVINTPGKEGNASDESYVLAFSPKSNKFPLTKFIWNYNGDWPFAPLGQDTELKILAEKGKVRFELLLPWKDIYPYHPWLSEKIGFNLIFSKAFGESDLGWYSVAADEGEKRIELFNNSLLQFEKPGLVEGTQSFMILTKNNIPEGETIKIKAVSISSASGPEQLIVLLFTGEREGLERSMFDYQTSEGMIKQSFDINTGGLIPGGYKIQWLSRFNDSSGETYLTVFPGFDQKILTGRIETLDDKISAGSLHTLKFTLNQIQEKENRLKSYDRGGTVRILMARFLRLLEQAEQGTDVIARRTGYVRRAFVSNLDGTLQPYTVKIPANYDPAKKYPAIVFLHGSDRDDTAVANHKYVGTDQFIIIAPNGRGPLTGYVLNHAQEDIQEAVADASKNYNIDQSNLILAGFSMGGYGAYRTYYETPGKYKAVAVFSGAPDIGNQYTGTTRHPNFSEIKYLKKFKGARIAIFHGRGDRNCPFELTDEIAKKLKSIGAEVSYFIDENVGHSPPRDKEIQKAYYRWLEESIKKK